MVPPGGVTRTGGCASQGRSQAWTFWLRRPGRWTHGCAAPWRDPRGSPSERRPPARLRRDPGHRVDRRRLRRHHPDATTLRGRFTAGAGDDPQPVVVDRPRVEPHPHAPARHRVVRGRPPRYDPDRHPRAHAIRRRWRRDDDPVPAHEPRRHGPDALASRLRVEPAVKLAVASTNGPVAILRPAAALRPGTLYRVSLLGADGAIVASWAAQTAGPLHVVETIPGDAATSVPLDAGIELIFDQAGVSTADLRDHLRIQPATAGRLQAAGRSVVFIPSKPLRRGTLYTVTVTRGLPIVGTGQRLEADVRIRFETSGPRDESRGRRPPPVASSRPRRASEPRWRSGGRRKRMPIRPLASRSRSIASTTCRRPRPRARRNEAPTWTRADVRPAVPTSGLPKLVDARLPVRDGDAGNWFLLPRPLAQGWYVVTVSWAGIPRQAVLQVTDLAVYALVTTTRSTVWVNDLKSARPVVGASVDLVGRSLGATNASGLVIGPTPPAARTLGTGTVPRRVLMEIRSAGRTSSSRSPPTTGSAASASRAAATTSSGASSRATATAIAPPTP